MKTALVAWYLWCHPYVRLMLIYSVRSCKISNLRLMLLPNQCHYPFAVSWLVDICCCDWFSLRLIVNSLLEPGVLLRGAGRPARGLASPCNTTRVTQAWLGLSKDESIEAEGYGWVAAASYAQVQIQIVRT